MLLAQHATASRQHTCYLHSGLGEPLISAGTFLVQSSLISGVCPTLFMPPTWEKTAHLAQSGIIWVPSHLG